MMAGKRETAGRRLHVLEDAATARADAAKALLEEALVLIKMRVDNGHSDVCAFVLSEDFPCDCGHDAGRDFLAKAPGQ